MNKLTPKGKVHTVKNNDNEKLDFPLKNTLKRAPVKQFPFSQIMLYMDILKRNSDEFLFYFTI